MSTQKGNISRTRPQKHKNVTVFKNNRHDTSHVTKKINGLNITKVCTRCKDVIEWKIKYKKYKPLKAPSTCVKCQQKTVKSAYHTLCSPCASQLKVCPKCGKNETIVNVTVANTTDILQDGEIQDMIKALSERRRRTFHRHMKKVINDEEIVVDKEYVIKKLEDMGAGGKGSNTSFDDLDDFGYDDDDHSDSSEDD